MFVDELYMIIIILIAIYAIIPCSSNSTIFFKRNDDMKKITLKSDHQNNDRIIYLFFTISSKDIITIKILVSIDDYGNAINDD